MSKLLNNSQDLYLIRLYYMKCMYAKRVWASVKVSWTLSSLDGTPKTESLAPSCIAVKWRF